MANEINTTINDGTGISVTTTDGIGVNVTTSTAPSVAVSKYELFTLDATDLSNKYVEVVGTIVDNQSIRVFIDNIGIKAEQGIDYSVSGSQIFWNTYALQSLLELGDKLKIFYI